VVFYQFSEVELDSKLLLYDIQLGDVMFVCVCMCVILVVLDWGMCNSWWEKMNQMQRNLTQLSAFLV